MPVSSRLFLEKSHIYGRIVRIGNQKVLGTRSDQRAI